MKARMLFVLLLLASDVAEVAAQSSPYEGVTFCVVPRDITIPLGYTGMSIRGSSVSRQGRAIRRSYPIVTEVAAGSPADVAGIRVDDEIRSEFGFDMARQFDSVRRHGPGVPIPIVVRRGDSTLRITVTPTELKEKGP